MSNYKATDEQVAEQIKKTPSLVRTAQELGYRTTCTSMFNRFIRIAEERGLYYIAPKSDYEGSGFAIRYSNLHGQDKKYHNWTHEEEKRVIALRKKGQTIEQIAVEMKRSYSSISAIITKENKKMEGFMETLRSMAAFDMKKSVEG